jgi:hypothetical protein
VGTIASALTPQHGDTIGGGQHGHEMHRAISSHSGIGAHRQLTSPAQLGQEGPLGVDGPPRCFVFQSAAGVDGLSIVGPALDGERPWPICGIISSTVKRWAI